MTGWASWSDPRQRVELNPGDGDAIRYCPRCDQKTVWRSRGDGTRQCDCGVTLTTILKPNEIARVQRHYARTI